MTPLELAEKFEAKALKLQHMADGTLGNWRKADRAEIAIRSAVWYQAAALVRATLIEGKTNAEI